jgi:hypothetical protein
MGHNLERPRRSACRVFLDPPPQSRLLETSSGGIFHVIMRRGTDNPFHGPDERATNRNRVLPRGCVKRRRVNTNESCEFIIINCCLSTLPVSAPPCLHEEVSISHSLTHSPEAGEEESPNTQTKAASNQQRPSYLCKRPKDFCTAI